jgi:hypothetical protein
MSKFIEFEFCELPDTPYSFDIAKFKAGDPAQIKLYKDNKVPRRKKKLTYAEVTDEDKIRNYARVVPEGCMFIDFDNPDEAEEMYDIITHSELKCLILETTKGYHFLFRVPDFYKKEMTGATNWFGYKFDTKGPGAVQIIRVCGMTRDERCSWELSELVAPASIDIDKLDVLPYWLWGKLKDTDLHKKGEPGESHYTLTDTPFTQLMKMKEGGRHNHIVEKCSMFALSNGFEMDEFKSLITAIHDQYLAKIGTPMPDSDLFGDLEDRWSDYWATLESSGWSYDEKERKWKKIKSKKEDKIDERRAAEYLFNQYEFYGNSRKSDGTFEGLLYKEIGGPYEYNKDITVFREALKEHSDQNFKNEFFKEVEVQLMQMCAAKNRIIARNDKYIIVKNKVLSCIAPDAYDFSWIGTRPPTDVVLPWNWYPEEWVEEHKDDLGANITWFIKQLARDSSGKTQPEVEQWLWVIAGASMVPANMLQKIVILSGGGQNGKSLYTSLIRLCLGADMFNESKIFDSNPHDGFWGEGLDKGILCVIDDLNRIYNRDAFSYIKGAITGTDSVTINEKFKAKKQLDILPQIIACTNFEFELYDKSEGMKRRVKILPTEFHVDDSVKDGDLQHKLVLNTFDPIKVAEYKMSEDSFNHKGIKVMNMYTGEKGVLDSLADGSLAWFANKARYMYIKWIRKELIIEDSESMKERMDIVFSGGFDAECTEFLEWYIKERKESIWTKELYIEYQDWHTEMATGDIMMNERAFARNLTKAINTMLDKGYKVKMKKTRNDKGMTLNRLFIGEGVVDGK